MKFQPYTGNPILRYECLGRLTMVSAGSCSVLPVVGYTISPSLGTNAEEAELVTNPRSVEVEEAVGME